MVLAKAESLVKEKHEVIVIEQDEERLIVQNGLDVMAIAGESRKIL